MDLLGVMLLVSALGSGVIAGVFFIFSVCVMKALGKLPAAHGIAAMQSINVVIINPLFLTAYLGTGAAGVAAAAVALMRARASAYALPGAALYLVGVVLVTGA